jgi:hypothetical protein
MDSGYRVPLFINRFSLSSRTSVGIQTRRLLAPHSDWVHLHWWSSSFKQLDPRSILLENRFLSRYSFLHNVSFMRFCEWLGMSAWIDDGLRPDWAARVEHFWPVNQAFYPKLTKQMHERRDDATKMVKLSLCFLGGLGLLFGVALFLGAPLLVHVVLGDAFYGSVAALRVFSLWIPLVALSTVITFQLLLPNQMDYQFNVVIFTAGLLSFGGALLLAPGFQAVGIAWSATLYLDRILSRVGTGGTKSLCPR